jgi:hypothetical protein
MQGNQYVKWRGVHQEMGECKSGIYTHVNVALPKCFEYHRARWNILRTDLTTISTVLRRLLSMEYKYSTRVVLCLHLVVMAKHFICGEVFQEFLRECGTLEMQDVETKGWSWASILLVFSRENAKEQGYPEFGPLFQILSQAILRMLRENDDPKLEDDGWLCGLRSSDVSVSDKETDTFHVFENFVKGHDEDMASLLMSVQIAARCVRLQNNNPILSGLEVENHFADIRLVEVHQKTKTNVLQELFQYPRTMPRTRGEFGPYVQCTVEFPGAGQFHVLCISHVLFRLLFSAGRDKIRRSGDDPMQLGD